MFFKTRVIKNFVIFTDLKVCNFIKKETPAQAFSCEYCEIFRSNLFHRTPPVAASAMIMITNPYRFTSVSIAFISDQNAS